MSADSSTTNKFAVVGPTQSGKTCLAVGLFATNASNFTIEPVDTDGSSYLMDLKGCIAEGKWPGTTNKGTKKEIRFDFVKKGKKPIRVAFWEFGGETLASDETFKQFVNEHLTKLSGVVLLVNPGADAFQSNSPGLFEDTMLQYKKVLSFLRDENNGSHKAFVALTVTAADRLTGDLKGKLQSFDQCVEELSNTLTVSGFRWERFDVTVTGPLKEQDKPELAKGRVNSAASPFLWLLDKLHWLPRRQVIFRKIRRVALAVGVLAALAGAWCGVDAWNDYGAIQKNENELRAAIAKWSDKNNPSDDDLGALRTPLVALKNHKGWFRKKAVASANAFEPEIWNVHEKRIRREWSGIAGEPEEYGGDCDRVDRVFNAWVPSVPKVAEERGKLKEEWDRNKPGYQDKFAVGQMLRGIQNPLMKMTETHGQVALSRLAELYAKLAKIDPVEPKSIALKGEIERKLDDRAKMEWGKFAIPDFGRKAPTNASHDATRAFVALLDGWKPATADGAAAKAELMAQVTNSIPTWRLGYETGTFNARIDAAKKSGTLEDLAALHPSRVVTNDYLRFDFVSNQWEVLVKRDFEAAVTNFVKKFTADISPRNRGRRPEFTDGDREEIDKTAKSVGAPFDAEAIKNMIGELMASKASAWDEGKRSACKKWVEENIARRPDRDRTGRDGIFDAYVNERRSYRDSEDIFNEIVRTAVYRKVEEWFESDLEFFREGKEGAEGRFESKFRPLCDRVYEDKKNHDPKSWAYPFVARCRDVGHVNKDGYGYATVFPQEFEISQVSGFVVYEGEAPWTKFLGMQIGVSVWTSGVEQVISPCNDDNEGLRVTDRTGEPKPLWSGNVKVRGSQFAPIEFTMKALAVRRGFDEELQRVRDDSFILFDGDPARNGFYGFSKTYTSEGREIKVGVNLAVRRLSGKSVGELLAEAKKEVAAGQK